MSPSALSLRLALVATVLALTLAGCGRKGPLEPPPGAVAAKPDPLADPDEAATPGPTTLAPTIAPVTGRSSKGRGKPISAPSDPFILDPIL